MPLRSDGMQMSEHYHLVGVAGVGMSALAQALLAEGHRVSGSDRLFDGGTELPVIRQLRNAGVHFVPQDGSAVTGDTVAVVVSTAIEEDNPDLAAAERLACPVVHRAEMLGRLLRGRPSVAVTGTSGKSTVTGMIGWILQELDADPVVVNGAVVIGWDGDNAVGNFRPGGSDLWVIEADESDRSLLQYHPDWAVVTNVSSDHFSRDETEELFRRFCTQVRIGCITPSRSPLFLDQCNPYVGRNSSHFTYGRTAFRLRLPGLHNAENALNAVLLCERLGYDREALSAALATFPGLRRRLECIGVVGEITVVDDYAHNPAKIRAAWRAFKPHCRRVISVWRPHGYGPLAKMLEALEETFRELCTPDDLLFFLPVYDAGGTAERGIQSDALCERLCLHGCTAEYVESYDELLDRIPMVAAPGDVVLVMGARDPHLTGLAHDLVTALGE